MKFWEMLCIDERMNKKYIKDVETDGGISIKKHKYIEVVLMRKYGVFSANDSDFIFWNLAETLFYNFHVW